MADISLSINFAAPQLRFIADMNRTLEHTLLSLRGIRDLNESPSELGTQSVSSVPAIRIVPRALDVARPEAERWLFTAAFRDAIEHVAAFFEGLREADALLALSARTTFTLEEISRVVVEPARQFDRRFFPQKVETLSAAGLIAEGDVLPLVSVNTARNCLVHRRGCVGASDVDTTTNEMLVAWTCPETIIRSVDGDERSCAPGSIVAAGESVLVRMTPVERRYVPGDLVQFCSEDIVGIWWTLLRFAEQSTRLLIAKARERGFTVDEQASTAVPTSA